MKRSELFFSFLLVPLDIVAVLLGFVVAYSVRRFFDPFDAAVIYIKSFREFLPFISSFIPIWLIVFAAHNLYSAKNTRKLGVEFLKILIAVPTALMLFVTVMFFIKETFFSRLILLYSLVSIILFVALFRLIIIALQRFLFRYGIGVKRILIIGAGIAGYEIYQDIKKNPAKGFRVLGVIKTNNEKIFEEMEGKNILGDIKDLGSIVAKINPDEIFQTDPYLTNEENINIIHLTEDKKISFRFVANLFSLYSKNNSVETFSNIPVFEIKRSPLDGWGRIIKRGMDIVGAITGIIVSLPLQIPIAIIIKATSRGPIFFTQERVGRDRNFRFYKFRSMYQDADKRHKELIKQYGNMFKLKDDPRVTPIGKFLRKTSLDELPQFYNVLRGDMSLVGPRPPMPIEVARYTREERKRVGGVKPGITGLWQVSGRSDISFDEWVKLDAYYIENWSLWLDIIIILKTIRVVLFKKGAY